MNLFQLPTITIKWNMTYSLHEDIQKPQHFIYNNRKNVKIFRFIEALSRNNKQPWKTLSTKNYNTLHKKTLCILTSKKSIRKLKNKNKIQVTIFHQQYSPFHFNHFNTTSFLTKFSTTPKDAYEKVKNQQGSPPSINPSRKPRPLLHKALVGGKLVTNHLVLKDELIQVTSSPS